jgi:pimeloyl-[acyl-carrier protein] methyl ester esterase
MSSAVWSSLFHSDEFRVIAIDLRGHGKSGLSAAGYGFNGFAEDVSALFDHLDIKGVILAGWSLGAQVVLQASSKLHDRLAGVVLVSGTPCFVASEDFPHALSKLEAQGMALKVRRNLKRALDGFVHRMFAYGELENKVLATHINQIMAAVPVPDTLVALESLKALIDADMRPLLDNFDLPTLIINGDQDRICVPEASDFMARGITGSEHLVIKSCGHAPFLSNGLIFETAIADFNRRIH